MKENEYNADKALFDFDEDIDHLSDVSDRYQAMQQLVEEYNSDVNQEQLGK